MVWLVICRFDNVALILVKLLWVFCLKPCYVCKGVVGVFGLRCYDLCLLVLF